MENVNHNDEDLLFGQLDMDEKKSFTSLYQSHYETVYFFLLKYLKSEDLSEDICQSVFLKMWENRDKLNEINNLKAYLLTIAKRQAIDFLKRASIEKVALSAILQAYKPIQNTTEDAIKLEEYMTFIERTLANLPAQTRQVFMLCRKQQKSYDEVAMELGISRNTVKKHMVRSLKALKNLAQNELGIPLSILLLVLNCK